MPADPMYVQLLDELLDLHQDKSQGYGTGADPFANLTAVASLAGEPAWRYPRRRAIEKLARLESLETQSRVDELEEEHLDIASLLLCAEVLRRRFAGSAEPRSPSPHPVVLVGTRPRSRTPEGVASGFSSHHPGSGLSSADPTTLFAERLRELADDVEGITNRESTDRELAAALRTAADLIGPERSEGPYVAPPTYAQDAAHEPAQDALDVHVGHNSCKSALFRSDRADAEILSRRVEAAGRGYEGSQTA